jgi:hypothetical protein
VVPCNHPCVDAPTLAGDCAIMLSRGVARVSLDANKISCLHHRSLGKPGDAGTCTPRPPFTYAI